MKSNAITSEPGRGEALVRSDAKVWRSKTIVKMANGNGGRGEGMKGLLILAAGGLLAMVILSTGCTTAERSAVASTQNITGELKNLSVAPEYDNGNANASSNVTVANEQGTQTIQLAENTTYYLDGLSCSLQEIGKVLSEGNTTYNCTVVIDDPCDSQPVAQFVKVSTSVQ